MELLEEVIRATRQIAVEEAQDDIVVPDTIQTHLKAPTTGNLDLIHLHLRLMTAEAREDTLERIDIIIITKIVIVESTTRASVNEIMNVTISRNMEAILAVSGREGEMRGVVVEAQDERRDGEETHRNLPLILLLGKQLKR